MASNHPLPSYLYAALKNEDDEFTRTFIGREYKLPATCNILEIQLYKQFRLLFDQHFTPFSTAFNKYLKENGPNGYMAVLTTPNRATEVEEIKGEAGGDLNEQL